MLLDFWSALCTVYSSCFLFVSNPTFSVCFALEMEGFCTETISFLSPYKNIQPDVVRKKMLLQWSRRCCNTCKTAWNVKFLLANCVILLRRRYKNKLLELQEKLSNSWAMFSMSTLGRGTIALCSWRWDQIRLKVSILNLHIWMLTLLWGIRRGEWGSAGALSWVHFALEILEESFEGSDYHSLSRFIALIWKVSLLEARKVIWWGSQWAFIGTLVKQYEAISQGFWTLRIHWVNLRCENSTLPPEVEWHWRSTAFLAVHVLGARCRCVSIWVTERVPGNAKVETHFEKPLKTRL